MALKNYSSQVSVGRSIGHIEDVLSAHGARQILKGYDDSQVTSVSFIIAVDGISMPFRLPARITECERVLRGRIRRPRTDTLKRIGQQAARTAWKIVSDWVDAQMAMIELSQVEMMEVFLPYVYDPLREQTYFEILKEQGFQRLLSDGG